MGQTCAVSTVSTDDELDPHRSLIKSELKRSKAEVLLNIPGAEVVIVDPSGEEATIASGGFRLVQLAPPSTLAVLFVGESFDDLSAQGFYYPLLADTPVCLSNRKPAGEHPGAHILTMTAGEGDIFGLKLPDPLPEEHSVQSLAEVLGQRCLLQVAQEPDLADKIVQGILFGGKKLIDGVEWATEKMSAGIAKGGEAARSKISKGEQDVEIGHGTAVAVSGAKFVTGGTVAVATAVTDTLMDTALMLGEQVRSSTNKHNEDGQPQPDSTLMKVTKASGMAGLQVFDALMQAGDRLLDEACDETSKTVGHRYGQEAERVAHEGLGIAKDVKQVNDLVGKKAVKRLAAKGAMYTAKGMLNGQPVKSMSANSLGQKMVTSANSPASSSNKA